MRHPFVHVALLVSVLLLVGSAGASAQSNPFGVVTQVQNVQLGSQGFSRLRELGVGSARIEIAWADVQSTLGGGFNFVLMDNSINAAITPGVDLFINLVIPPVVGRQLLWSLQTALNDRLV